MSNIKFNSFNTSKHKYSSSIIQKIPSISFSFDNKFQKEEPLDKINHIPCLFIKYSNTLTNPNNKSKAKNNLPSLSTSDKILIYFHANYEDLGYTYNICSSISRHLKINVLSVEYPNYGIYKSNIECSSEAILEDAEDIYKFLVDIKNIEESKIIIQGRCIGSGPATYLASKYKPISLVLISPFKSIKEAVKSIFGKIKVGWILEKFVKER